MLLGRAVVAIAVNAFALWLCTELWDSVQIHGWWAYILGAGVLALANTIIKPIVALITLPLIIITLGVFLLLINIAMVALAEWIAPNFSIDGFWTYVGVVFIVWLVNAVANLAVDALDRPRARYA